MNYLILSAIVIIIAYFYDTLKKLGKLSTGLKVTFYVAICLVLCVFAGLRTSYNDTGSYILQFKSTSNNFSSLFFEEFSISQVYLFKIWNYVIYNFITKSAQIYLFLCAVVFVCPAVYLIDRYSKNFTFSMLLFMLGGLYIFSLAGLKQAMATGMIMLGIPCLIKKQYIKYYIFCILALGFHTYSIFFLILPLLGMETFNVRTIVFSLSVIFVGIMLPYFSGVISAIIDFMGKDVDEQMLETGSVSIFRAIVFAVPLVLSILGRDKLKDIPDHEKVFIKIGILSSIFMILALFGNPILFGRIPQYFLIGIVVSLPLLIEKAFVVSERKVILGIASVCYAAFGIYALYNEGAFAKDIFRMILF